ncbi:MAG: hypothetical protein ABEH65_05640 [Halobacteriales archaeon]
MKGNNYPTTVSRRGILKRSAIVSGGFVVGGVALSGSTAAHNAKGVGYIRGVEEGDTVTLVEDLRPEKVELGCEGNNGKHKVRTADTDIGFNINILNNATNPEAGDTLEIVKVILTCRQNQSQGKQPLKKVQFEVKH